MVSSKNLDSTELNGSTTELPASAELDTELNDSTTDLSTSAELDTVTGGGFLGIRFPWSARKASPSVDIAHNQGRKGHVDAMIQRYGG